MGPRFRPIYATTVMAAAVELAAVVAVAVAWGKGRIPHVGNVENCSQWRVSLPVHPGFPPQHLHKY